MFRTLCIVFSSLALVVIVFAQSRDLAGLWQGTLELPGAKLRLVFHVTRNADGSYAAKADSPDQGATGLAVDEATLKDGNARFVMMQLQAAFDGKLSADGGEIVGTFRQAGVTMPLTLKRVAQVEAPRRPQLPQKPYPYEEEEVSYLNPRGKHTLAGTLTKPKGNGPFAAALLITGSGAQDRDESLMGHKPFLVIADSLTRRGLAVLRVDDRSVGKSTGDFATATSLDLADDVTCGVRYLKSRKDIDAQRIGLIGHSEGGLIAPIVAARNPKDLAFLVLLAGPGTTGEEIIYAQSALIAKANGASEAIIHAARERQQQLFALLRKERDPVEVERQLRTTVGPEAASEAAQAQLRMVLSPWFRYFLTFDPKTALRHVKCPVLALNGEKDLQVPAKENLSEIRRALMAANNKSFVTKELPGLNHLFQTCKTGSPGEYAQIEETFSPAALKLMGDWIGRLTRQL